MPVVDLAALVSGAPSASIGRFVVLRTGDRRVALAVEAVLGLAPLHAPVGEQLPRLLARVGEATVSTLVALDSSLLAVLDATHLVPEELWPALSRAGA